MAKNKDLFITYSFIIMCIISECWVNGYALQKIVLKMFRQCSNETDLPIVLSDFKIYQKSKGEYFIDGTIIVKQDMPENWMIKTDVNKCTDAFNLELCEIYLDKLKSDDGCTVLGQTIIDFPDAFANFDPTIKCPLTTGTYKLKDCPVNSNVAILFTYGSAHTILIKVQGFDNEKKLFCMDSRFDITNRKINVT